MIGYNVAVLLWPITGTFQELARSVRCVRCVNSNQTLRLVCLNLLCNKLSPCEVVNGKDNHPLFHRTPGYHRWTSSETRGSAVSGRSIKRRTYRCLSLRYPLPICICQLFPCGKRGAVKSSRHTPSIILGLLMQNIKCRKDIGNRDMVHACFECCFYVKID